MTDRTERVAIIVGAGPGVSGSFARLLADDGWDIGLVGADQGALDELSADLEGRGSTVGTSLADVTDTEAATAALTRMADHTGRVDLLHFNPSAFREKDPLELTVAELLQDVALGVGALLTAVQAVRPFMSAGARVTVARARWPPTSRGTARRPWASRRPAYATSCTRSTRRSRRTASVRCR